jgi:hypothetical protein
MIASDRYNFNKHVWDMDPRFYVIQRKYVLAIEVIFCFVSGLIKISILLFFRRLSVRAVSKTFAWATWFSIGFIASSSIAFALVPLLGCRPFSAFWDQADVTKMFSNDYKYTCFNEGIDVFSAAVVSAVQDLLAALLPTFLYWNLRIPVRQKIALFGIFAIGYGAVAMGALRAYYSWRLFWVTYDVTWQTWYAWITALLELHIGAICANAPALKVFCKEYLNLDKLVARSRTNSKGMSSNGLRSKSSSHGTFASSRVGTIFVALCFRNSDQTRQKDGYLSGPYSNVSIDHHGGVLFKKDADLTHSDASMLNSVDIINDRYNADIELGSYRSPSHGSGSKQVPTWPANHGVNDLQALPSFSSRPYPVNATPRPPPNVFRHTFSHFPPKSQTQSPAWQGWS